MYNRIILFVFITVSSWGFSQTPGNSLVSVFGYGQRQFDQNAEVGIMGLYNSYSSETSANFSNPASLYNLRLTSFYGQVNSDINFLNYGDVKQNISSTYFQSASLAFPISSGKSAIGVGISPYSSINYNMGGSSVSDDVTSTTSYTGKGNISKLNVSAGVLLFKGFSVGASLNYLFGQVDYTKNVFQDNSLFKLAFEDQYTLRGFGYDMGVQYNATLKENYFLSAGVTLRNEANLTKERDEYAYRYVDYTGQKAEIDVQNLEEYRDLKYSIPQSLSVGIGLGKKNKWFAGVDYETYENAPFNDNAIEATYDKASKFSLGGYITPNYNSIRSYWSRVTYRAGLTFEDYGITFDNESLTTTYGSFGVGLPIGTREDPFSSIEIGLQYGSRGNISNLNKEKFFNLRIGINLNGVWFKKNKYY